MVTLAICGRLLLVAPARERGLKFCVSKCRTQLVYGRSREGAWIEIAPAAAPRYRHHRRSREGAWIEIASSARSLSPTASLPRGSVD